MTRNDFHRLHTNKPRSQLELRPVLQWFFLFVLFSVFYFILNSFHSVDCCCPNPRPASSLVFWWTSAFDVRNPQLKGHYRKLIIIYIQKCKTTMTMTRKNPGSFTSENIFPDNHVLSSTKKLMEGKSMWEEWQPVAVATRTCVDRQTDMCNVQPRLCAMDVAADLEQQAHMPYSREESVLCKKVMRMGPAIWLWDIGYSLLRNKVIILRNSCWREDGSQQNEWNEFLPKG